MKFITISTLNDAGFALPEGERNKIAQISAQELLDKKTKRGDKFRFFVSGGSRTSYALEEFDTYEEYAQSLNTQTYSKGLVSFVSVPVIEVDEKILKASLDTYKAAAKKK